MVFEKGHTTSQATRDKIRETLKKKGIRPMQRFCARGSEHPSWRGGITKDEHGYVMIKRLGHHRADKRGYVKRSVIIAEAILARELMSWEIVHHKNRIKNDDNPDNLEVMSKGDHIRLHKPRRDY